MSTVPQFVPILSAGAHPDPSEGACVMEMASFLAGEAWSDRPACTHPALAGMARVVNDHLPDERRGVLLDLLPRLMGTTPTGTEAEQHRLSVGLAVWCAEQVVHLAGEGEPQAREAIRVVRAWLAGEATSEECRAATCAAYVAYDATSSRAAARFAANAAASAASNAASNAARTAAWATYAARDAADDLVGLLTGLLDEYDRLAGRTAPEPLTGDDLAALAALTNA